MVGTKPVLGLAELVWNAVDANATNVAITVKRNELDAVDQVIVADNGHGFSAEDVKEMFGEVDAAGSATPRIARPATASASCTATRAKAAREPSPSVTRSSGPRYAAYISTLAFDDVAAIYEGYCSRVGSTDSGVHAERRFGAATRGGDVPGRAHHLARHRAARPLTGRPPPLG